MAELHRFLFQDLPVRGTLVRLTEAWQTVLARRAQNPQTGPYPTQVAQVLGELSAAAVLLQASIQFEGALVIQLHGDGPLKLAVVEVQPDFSFRATAKTVGSVEGLTGLSTLANPQGTARCAVTLDPIKRLPGQQPYQGLVPLVDAQGRPMNCVQDALAHYMLQSEQLDTTLVLAANDQMAAGLMIQRVPLQGQANLAGAHADIDPDEMGHNEDYNRLAHLTASLTVGELLGLGADDLFRRLYWQESLLRFPSLANAQGPRFACRCSRERVSTMLRSLGQEEAHAALAEKGVVEVGCDFCGQQYRFDAVDLAQLFAPSSVHIQGSPDAWQ